MNNLSNTTKVVLILIGIAALAAAILGAAMIIGNQLTAALTQSESNAEEETRSPYITLTTNDGGSYTYKMGADNSIWMTGDDGLESWKDYGGTATLTVTNGYEVQVYVSAGTASGPLGACNLGNPMSCNGYYWVSPGTYTFTTYGANDSAGIKVDVREK